MGLDFSFYIKRFFLGGEINTFRGIKSLRYRLLFILEPVFLFLAIISSIAIQDDILANEYFRLLTIMYFVQLTLIIFSIIVFKRNRLNRSYTLFLLLLFTSFTSLHLHSITVYSWLFMAVLLSSLIFRIRRTAFTFIILIVNLLISDRGFFIQLIYSPENINIGSSIVFFTIVSSLLMGSIISIIVYYLEKSFSHLYKLQRSLDNKNTILNQELEAKNKYKNALRGNELKFKTIVEYGFDGITILDKEGNNKFISNSTEKITGYSAEEFNEGAITFDKIHPDDMQRVVENFRAISENRIHHSTIYYRYMHKDGDWRNLEVSVSNLVDHPGIEGILFVYRDVTKHIRAEQRARYFEYYDQLTDLPNQLMFSDKISEEIERSAARNRSFAVMCLVC